MNPKIPKTMDKETILRRCTIHGNTVKLPEGQLDRKLYQEVAKSLELIGGKWKGKPVFGFIFPENPGTLLAEIATGEVRNLKKEFQFFPTPKDLAQRLVEMADIDSPDLLVLEPSAGQGAIVNALLKAEPGLIVHAYELMPVNRQFLEKIKDCVILGEDFLNPGMQPVQFDRIVANPPFSKNQDIDHITEMYKRLKDGGRLVSIAGTHWKKSENKKEKAFRDWLDSVGAEIEDVEAGTFSESGTKIATCIIIIDK